MNIRYLIDENLDPLFKAQLLIKKPGLIVYAVGDPGSPSRGMPDPEILCWCEENSFVLVSASHLTFLEHIASKLSKNALSAKAFSLHVRYFTCKVCLFPL